jgi:hypothetical protein
MPLSLSDRQDRHPGVPGAHAGRVAWDPDLERPRGASCGAQSTRQGAPPAQDSDPKVSVPYQGLIVSEGQRQKKGNPPVPIYFSEGMGCARQGGGAGPKEPAASSTSAGSGAAAGWDCHAKPVGCIGSSAPYQEPPPSIRHSRHSQPSQKARPFVPIATGISRVLGSLGPALGSHPYVPVVGDDLDAKSDNDRCE